jgi:histidine ammonia-lyase
MGVTAGLKLRGILDNVERILALELMAAAQGVEFRRQDLGFEARLGRGTGAAFALLRRFVPFVERDEVLYPHIEAARRLVADGRIVAAVEAAL